MNIQSVFSEKYRSVILGMVVLVGLYFTSLHNYLLFHSFAEIFSIIVACGIFIVAWNSRRFHINNYFLFIGIAYIFIGGMDLVHTLAYKGMGVFEKDETNVATQIWISSRYLESVSLLVAPLFLDRRLHLKALFLGYAGVVTILFGAIFYWRIFPVCFIEGVGLTPFKKISEYIISFIFAGAIAFLNDRRRELDEGLFRLLIASILVRIGSELAFTFYMHAYGMFNFIGHYLKIISYYLIYKAFIEATLIRPYDLLFRDVKKSEVRYRAVVEDQTEMICRFLPDMTLTFVNDAYCRYFNKEKEILLRHPFKPPFNEYEIKEFYKNISFLSPKNPVITMEFRVRINEKIFWHRWMIRAIFDDKDCLREYQAVGSDVTMRKRIEEALRESEEKYRTMMEAMLDPVYICSADFRISYMNRAMIQRIGRSATGEVCYKAINDLDEKCPFCVHDKIQQKMPMKTEILSPKDGRFYHVSHFPVFHSDGSISKMTIYRDITEHKKAEDLLRWERDRAQMYLDIVGVILIIIDADQTVSLINRKGSEVLGYADEEIIGKNWFDNFIPKRDREQTKKEFEKLLEGNIEIFIQFENSVLTKKGEERIIAWHNTVLRDDAGNIIGTLSSGEDITLQKRAEELLKKAHEELEKRISDRTAQVHSLSAKLLGAHEDERKRIGQELHDGLAQNLSAIKIWVESALVQMDTHNPNRASKLLKSVVPLAQGAVEDVRRISRNLRPSILDDFGILATISWLCNEFKTIYPHISIEEQINIKDSDVPDPLKIIVFRILQEALNNVVRHSQAKHVQISLKRSKGKIELKIHDDGVGFDVEQILSGNHIMEGLGLGSMRERAELSEGRLSIESKRGAGTTIRSLWSVEGVKKQIGPHLKSNRNHNKTLQVK